MPISFPSPSAANDFTISIHPENASAVSPLLSRRPAVERSSGGHALKWQLLCLGLFLAACGIRFLLSPQATASQREQAAIRQLENRGAMVFTEPRLFPAQQGLPRDSGERVTRVFLGNPHGLVYLPPLQELEELRIKCGRLTESDWAHLRSLPKLTTLQLESCDDAALERIRSLTQLRSLTIVGRMTDAGLAHLRELKQLTELRIRGHQVTSAGLACGACLTRLETLALEGQRLDFSGLEHFRNAPELRMIELTGPSFNNAGVVTLDLLPAVRQLRLRDTRVTEICRMLFTSSAEITFVPQSPRFVLLGADPGSLSRSQSSAKFVDL